ncbi:glycosyltransferase [Candidatus Neomarinimicrobiota bacterium]
MHLPTEIKISVITSLYRGERYLDDFFNSFLSISNLNETELILIHNDPTESEIEIINIYKDRIPNIQIVQVPREGVYSSWNRAIKISTGRYIAMWNVDDRRTIHSLSEQAKMLDNDFECMIVSGDYYKILKQGDENGFLKKDPVFNNGCFLMWRKSLHDRIGYFDEQFKIGGDHDFWMRATTFYKAGRINEILGYYLREYNVGISKENNMNYLENAVIKSRYYRYFIIDIYSLYHGTIINNIFLRKKIKNFNYYVDLNVKPKAVMFSYLISLFLFWIPNLKRILIRYKYSK